MGVLVVALSVLCLDCLVRLGLVGLRLVVCIATILVFADAAEMEIALVATSRVVTIVAIAVGIALEGAVNVLPVGLTLVLLRWLLTFGLVVVHSVVVWL